MTSRKFIEYNRQDVALLDKLDKKLRFIDSSNELAPRNTVLLQTTAMGAVAVTEQAIVNEAHTQRNASSNRVRREPVVILFQVLMWHSQSRST